MFYCAPICSNFCSARSLASSDTFGLLKALFGPSQSTSSSPPIDESNLRLVSASNIFRVLTLGIDGDSTMGVGAVGAVGSTVGAAVALAFRVTADFFENLLGALLRFYGSVYLAKA